MTKEAISKLPEDVRSQLEVLADVMLYCREAGLAWADSSHLTAKLRGYLECLMHLKIITVSEMRCLFLYYKDITTPFNN